MDEFEDDEGKDNFDPNDTEEDIDDDFDPNDTEEDIDDNFDPNDTEEDIDDDFDPNDTEEDIEDDFDPNDTEEDKFNDKFNPSEETQYHNENIGSQSTSTVLTNKIEEIEGNVGQQEQEEEIEIRSEEYQNDTEPIVNSDEIEFIKDIEELAEQARKINAEDENIEPQTEKENAAYYAEQYYETLKEKEVVNDSKEEQETEELRQEVTEELNSDQESDHNSDNLEEEDIIEASKITSTEEFEYLWEIRDKLEQEGKTSEEIEEVMHEAEKMYETLKDAEKLYEEQQQEKLKLVDHEDEASEEDLKEDLDREDLIEQSVELEEKLIQQGNSQEEIDMRVEESIETTKFEEKLENIIEEQEREKLKLVDHEDEASEEDLKEDLDRIDLVEQAVELEEELVQQGESQEEIDVRVEESIETTKFEEKLEKIIEEQEREKLKLVDHEDEASEEDLKECLDRIDLIEQAVELEENLVQQGESQEEIDIRVEESIEEALEEKEVETYESVENKENLEVLKPELDTESESEYKKDLLEESTKLVSEESDEEENERLQELYRQETGRRPIYSRKKTNGYSQWLEQRELGSEKIKNSKSESEKKKEIKEEDWKTTLKQWINETSEEECNAELKSELKKALESYNEFEDLTRKFLELYEKSQYEKLAEIENNRLKSLTERLQGLGPIQLELLANIRVFKDYFYNHLWELLNMFFVNRVRSKFFKHISQNYKELRKEQKNEKIKYLNICRVNQGNLGENSLNPLNSKQIKKYEQIYHRKLENLCVKYALDFKNIIIDEYGYKLLDLEKQIPLSSHFDFRLDKYIRNVTHLKRDRAVGAGILERVRLHVVQKYNTLERDAAKETSFKKVINFIREYKEFSRYVSRRFSISHIKYQQSSEELAPKSWLIENLRYIFPKRFGLPISDNLLSWFIYCDSLADGRKSKLIRTTLEDEINKRSHLAELLSIDYSANKLTKKAFNDKGIEMSDKDLDILKKSVSFLIYYYVFGGYHESTYVSKTTNKGLEVGRDYFTIEYEVIRAIFFVAAEGNNGEPMSFETIKNAVGVSTSLNKHLVHGIGFGDDFVNLFAYFDRLFKNRLINSNSQIFQNAEKILNEYKDAYKSRRKELQKSRGYRTAFQKRVHDFIEDFLGLKFNSEEQVRGVVKTPYITTINDNYIKEKIYVHSSFAFDGYLELNKILKDYLNLNDKWIGIAFEAMGTYWHSLPKQIEADRKKRLICKEKNIILLEILESLDSSAWENEILKQFKKFR